jgi:hypothetical protein
MFLRIANPGVAPVEGFTVLGVSTTRYAGSDKTIGQFGSGSKHAVNLLLRNDLRPVIYAGNLRMEFSTRPNPINDGLMSRDYSRVMVTYDGTHPITGKSKSGTEDLGFMLEHGVHDWTDVSMALREFVSNALDRTVRETGDFKAVEIDVVTTKPRARKGWTTVFVPYSIEVEKFHRELPKRFLHFSEPHLLNEKILPKGNRNLTEDGKGAVIYKKGVFIREYTEDDKPSVFDYNLGDELELDESRNSQPYVVKGAVAKALGGAPAERLVALFAGFLAGVKTFEGTLDGYYLKPRWDTPAEEVEVRKEAFQTAWKAAAGDDAVVVSGTTAGSVAEFVKKKGYTPKVIEDAAWAEALGHYGVTTDSQVLTDLEKKGSTISEATPDMLAAVDKVWNLLDAFGMTNGRSKPPVKAFTEILNGESMRLGYWERATDTVFLHTDLGDGQSKMLLQTALEEVVHHVTKAGDMSRDLQDFLFRLVIKIGL